MNRHTPSVATVFLLLGAVLLTACPALADFVTPGLGSLYTMDGLVAQSGGVVTGSDGNYQIHESVIISVNDLLDIGQGQTLTFQDATGLVGLEINGGLVAMGTADEPIVMTGSLQEPGSWRGLDFNDTSLGSQFQLTHVEIAYAMIGVDVFGADIQLDSCDIHHSLDKALDFSQAGGMVTNCHLHHNQQRTVVMTLTSSPTFEYCVLDNNNLNNSSPYPYFNIGLQGINSPTIRGCTITGDGNEMSGGMALWNSSNALIENNIISGCGYGILCYSVGANPTIVGNTIFDNTIHPDQVNWGFGVACNGDNAPILMSNTITGHWYGVAAINGGQPNLGDVVNDFPGDDGLNQINTNGLGGATYGFFNNTPLPQMAQNNFWGPVGPEDSIQHQVDNPALGLVTYDPVADVSAAPELPGPRVLETVTAHPNPFNPRVDIRFSLSRDSHVTVVVFDVAGRLVKEVQSGNLGTGEHAMPWDGTDRAGHQVTSGLYFYRVIAGNESQTGKLTLVR
jgi:parallel beta-helix repeat protein|nr:right-handed parallel beta-helix repeat-containing protein [Candidatus Krumholzibacteria bacterium]